MVLLHLFQMFDGITADIANGDAAFFRLSSGQLGVLFAALFGQWGE